MTPIFPELPHPLGVYTITRLLMQGGESELYIAAQGHTGREVLIELMRPAEEPGGATRFLARARARALHPLPHTAAVFEALQAEGLWFLTLELPEGITAAQLIAQHESLPPARCAELLAAAAELYAAAEAAGAATRPLQATDVFLPGTGSPCFLSPLLPGAAGNSPATRAALADIIRPLIPVRGRGTAALHRLTAQLLDSPELPWQDIADQARRLSRQLAPLLPRLRRSLVSARVALPGLFLLALGAGLLLRAARSSKDILCRSAETELLVQFRPVTVAEYAQYLDEQEKDTPHWELYPENWVGQRQQEQAPVTGVSHAQAEAYARAHGAVLPPAACLQGLFAAAEAAPSVPEWSSTRVGELLPELPQGDTPVAVSPTTPYPPLPDAERASFRIATPHP